MPEDESEEWSELDSDSEETSAESEESPRWDEESPSEDNSERSPMGAMDRSPEELGPAGTGSLPGNQAPESGADSDDDFDADADAAADTAEPAEDAPEHGSERPPATGNADDRADEPLSELREELSERGEVEVEDEEFEELFEEIDVGSVDEESVWEQLSETAEEPLFAPDDAETIHEADVTVVEKSLCHRCPHFGDPPELHCTHEGTTIDAEVDTEHFRVVNCPVVAQRADGDASDFSTDDL